jgi:hypothetical protein
MRFQRNSEPTPALRTQREGDGAEFIGYLSHEEDEVGGRSAILFAAAEMNPVRTEAVTPDDSLLSPPRPGSRMPILARPSREQIQSVRF